MIRLYRLVAAFSCFFFCPKFSQALELNYTPDPYQRVHSVKLKNGLKVVLSPSDEARTFQIKVKVDGGVYNELPGKAGVAHLLEHYLFTDAKLEKDMTYLEAIKEKGGSGNAFTKPKETAYFATVPAALSPWIVDIFGKILFQKEFDAERVQQAKGPVFLEIGRPNVFDYFMQAFQSAWPEFARPYDFWRTEFNVEEPIFKTSAARLQTEALTHHDLENFYAREYYPSNMTLFVAGKFNEAEMIKSLQDKFGNEPDRKGEGWVDPTPQARIGNYVRSKVTSGVPMIELGTKVAGISFEDEIVGRVYLGYLSHRLMKDLRNVRGDTYTVREDIELRKGNGNMTIKFEAPREDYSQNLNLVKGMLERETRRGEFTKDMFQEARSLYEKTFELTDRDSGTMMYLADRVDYLEREYTLAPQHKNDYEAFQAIGYEDFMRRLPALFMPNMQVSDLTEPPLLFRFEYLILSILAFAFWMQITRRIFSKKFSHAQIRWVRKMSYPPAYLLQFLAFMAIMCVGGLVGGLVELLCLKVDWIQHSYLTSDYLDTIVEIGLILIASQCILGLFMRKAMVVEDSVWLKSLGYYAQTFKLSEIEKVEVQSLLSLGLSPRTLFKVKYRYYYYDLCFWKKGLLIHLKDHRSYFLGIRLAKEAEKELISFYEKEHTLGSSGQNSEPGKAA